MELNRTSNIEDPRMAGIAQFLNENWKNRRCPSCNRLPNWETDFTVYTAPEYAVLSAPQKALAVIHLSCSFCGYTHLFAANKVGAMAGLPTITYTAPTEEQPQQEEQGTDANGSPVEG